jgi:hypothetical protein
MTAIRNTIVNVLAVIVAVAAIIGLWGMYEIPDAMRYIHNHLESPWLLFYFYFCIPGLFMLAPTLAVLAFEERFSQSKNRLLLTIADMGYNARNSLLSFFAVMLLGGIVSFFSIWGASTVICSF